MSGLRSLTFLVVALALLVPPAAAQPGQKLALVIGNSSYAEAPLKNPVNDARAVAAELRIQGFEVIFREDAKRRDMETAIADFGEKLSEGATGLFFYAGHGMQLQGRNYLVPVDARITAETRVRFEAVDMDGVLDQMQAARTRVSVVILDACRNNPFERRFRSTGGGLAQLNAPEGTLVAYATAPGKVASDGAGSHGLYTREFLRAIRMPGLKIEEVFKQVRINVSRASGGSQVPWEASSLTGDFYFKPPAPVTPPPPVAAPSPVPGAPSLELAFWESMKGSSDPGELQAYIQRFPEGTFVPLAQARVAALATPIAPPADPAPPPMQQAAPDNSVELALWDSVKGSNNPAELQAYLDQFPSGLFAGAARTRMAGLNRTAVAAHQAALSAANSPDIEGRYVTRFQGPRGLIDATLDIKGARLSGFAFVHGDNMGYSARSGMCRIAGTVDRAAVIEHMELDCEQYSWRLNGRFEPDSTGSYGATTAAQSINAASLTIVWKKATGN
jgi:uncharacterized caspase-like protein